MTVDLRRIAWTAYSGGRLLTVAQAAEKLGVKLTRLYTIVDLHQIPIFRVGGHLRLCLEDLTQHLETYSSPAPYAGAQTEGEVVG